MHVCIIGSGPVGLETALRLHSSHVDTEITILECGKQPAWNLKQWGHVRLFSATKLNVSDDGVALLKQLGHKTLAPDERLLGREHREQYLLPIADHLFKQHNCHVKCNQQVVSIAKESVSKSLLDKRLRSRSKFVLLVNDVAEEKTTPKEYYLTADVVVDATGTYGNLGQGGRLGPGGFPVLGESTIDMSPSFFRTIPDILGAHKPIFEPPPGKQYIIGILGNGYSAITTLNQIIIQAQFVDKSSSIKVVWIARTKGKPYRLIEDDPLPQREYLSRLGNALAGFPEDKGEDATGLISNLEIQFIGNSGVHSVERLVNATDQVGHEQIRVSYKTNGQDTVNDVVVDALVSNVGYRPNLDLFRELQVHQCFASEGPMKMAASLLAQSGDASADCLQQAAPGPKLLENPEPRFFVLGMKSYGRSSSFLMRVGLQQVDGFMELFDGILKEQEKTSKDAPAS